MLYLVRHGQTESNAASRLQGSSDSPLTPLGLQQAADIGDSLCSLIAQDAGYSIISSPLPRALATAEIIKRKTGTALPIATDDRLREVSLGCWEGLTTAEIDARWPDADVGSSVRLGWTRACPDGESLDDALGRLDDWLTTARGRNLIVVSHGIVGSLLRGLFAKLSEAEMLRLPVPHSAIFQMEAGEIRQFDTGT